MRLSFRLNGRPVVVEADPQARLLDILRSEFRLFGVREGCGEGECGSCTILFNGLPAASCLLFAGQAEGADILTPERLNDSMAGALKEAFAARGAVQYGFWTPGLLVSAYYLLNAGNSPSEAEIRAAMSGNLCRCTGYIKIFKAGREAAQRLAGPAGGSRHE